MSRGFADSVRAYADRAAAFGRSLGGTKDRTTADVLAALSPSAEARQHGARGRAVTRRLVDVEPVCVTWLWAGHVPVARLTILDGDPGLGKSTVTLDLAARVTTGRPMPDGSPGLNRPFGVVLLGAEDGLADTVRPRLDAAGADVRRVVALTGVRERSTEDGAVQERLPTVYDVDAIAEAARQVDAALLVVDPLVAYMAGADTHRDANVRQALADLAALAEDTGLAVLAVRHLTKGGGGNPLYRGGGSIAFIAAARSGMLLARDLQHEDRLVLARTKGNLAPPWPSLALQVVAANDVAHVEWLGGSEQSAADLLGDPEARTVLDEAVEWLRDFLTHGSRPAKDVRCEAASMGISARTLARARKRLGVVKERVGFGRGGEWRMSLPAPPSIGGHGAGPPMESDELAAYAEDVALQGSSTNVASIECQDRDSATNGINEPPHNYCAAGCGAVVGRAGVTCAACLYSRRVETDLPEAR